MPRIIQRWPGEVIHCGIDNRKGCIAGSGLYPNNARQQDAGVSGDDTAGFEHQTHTPVLGYARNHCTIFGGFRGVVTVAIAHAKAAAQVNMGDFVALIAQFLNQDADFCKRCLQRLKAGQLAADMQRNAAHIQTGQSI